MRKKRWSLSDSNSWPCELWMSMMFCRYTASCHIISHPTSFSFAMLGWPRLLSTATVRKKEIYSLLYKISSIVFHLLSSFFIWDKFQVLPCFTRTYRSHTVVTRHQTPLVPARYCNMTPSSWGWRYACPTGPSVWIKTNPTWNWISEIPQPWSIMKLN
jgi:hypothetical protein